MLNSLSVDDNVHKTMGSDSLFAMPSMLSGAARTLDLGSTFDGYVVSPDGDTADARALFSDWHEIGEDLVDAVCEFDSTQPDEETRQLSLGFGKE